VATRITPDIFGRVLFEAQGEYADRFWRPVNVESDEKQNDHPVFLRQAEANVDKDRWYLHAFSGVGHSNWQAHGDFFGLYPESFPDDDYLGSSSLFGLYPVNWRQDFYLNISGRHVPRGAELGGNAEGIDAAAAYGDELSWGYRKSGYGRATFPIRDTKLSFVYKDENVPYDVIDPDARDRAYALSWAIPSDEGHRLDFGVKYEPFRVDETYQVARAVPAGEGAGGSSTALEERRTNKKDAFAERIRLERHQTVGNRVFVGVADLQHAGVIAGNKDELGLDLGTDVTPLIRGTLQYTYRRPVEGAVPLLYEGRPDNIGAIVASPRGPESPFTVDWNNREAVFVVATLAFDPTPGTNMFLYDPTKLASWNVNPKENAEVAFAVQYRASDYKGTTDRQWYFDQNGDVQWEPAAHTGAWASDGFLHEFRVLSFGKSGATSWTLGIGGGQALAFSGLAYSTSTASNKPITDYYSIEGRLEHTPIAVWAHYGSGMWGPERNTHPFFGFAFDKIFGGGITYNLTTNTSIDLNYLGVREHDNMFIAPDLGSYDEIRTVFSHRFGFLFQFQESARPGYQAR
jgi:hypothetical protein